MNVEYRHPDENDAEDIARIVNLSGRELKHHTDTTADKIRTWTFEDKDYDPKGHLLGFADGVAVAYAGAIISKANTDAASNHAYMDISVLPEWRGKGIEEHFLGFVSGYLRSMDVALMRLWASREFAWKIYIATKTGMTDVRHSFMMVHSQEERPVESGIPEGYTLHHTMMVDASDEELKDLMNLLNDVFSENWGFIAQEFDDFTKDRDEERRTGNTKSRLAFARVGEKTVGACIGIINNNYNQQHDAKAGWSSALGVVKAHRRYGLGRALLADSMSWLWDRGMDTLYLGVDAENEKALKLYSSLSYTVEQEAIVYELKL